MIQYQPFSPVDIRFTELRLFQKQLDLLTDKRVMILASEGTVNRLNEYEGFGSFVNARNNRLITDIRPNPSVEDIVKLLNSLRYEDSYDCILAIGGGSCIDLAKTISALRGLAIARDLEYEEVIAAIQQKVFFHEDKRVDVIAVPTTAGTGSEVTKWATVWDFRNKKKLSVEHQGCFPKAAIIIPELTRSMPKKLTLSTGLDALSHAMEAFWAIKRNPLSQALALCSIEKIKKALPAVLKGYNDINYRKEMCIGSLIAGLAFSMTKTTACHSISYPLTLNYGIEHGFAAAMTLSQVAGINAKVVPEIEEIMKLFGDDGGFKIWMADVTRGIQELRLSAFGINEAMLDSIAKGAFTLGRMDNNPYPLDEQLIKKVLQDIF